MNNPIAAARELAKPFVFSHNDHTSEVSKQNNLYCIVLNEHSKQTKQIHIPDTVSPKSITLSNVEKLFLWYLNGKRTDIQQIGVYWYIEYQLYDYQACVQKLFDGGFLTIASPSESLPFLSASDLRGILQEIGAPTSGTKKQLCKRIRGLLSAEHLDQRYPQYHTFHCTDSGNAILKQSAAIIYFHRHRMSLTFSMSQIEGMAKRFPSLTGEEIVGALSAAKDKNVFMKKFSTLCHDEQLQIYALAKRRLTK